jgi:hypothetical protein
MTKLVVGKDYGIIFGLDANHNQHMIYNGNDSWTAINGELQQTDNSPETTTEIVNHLYMMPDYKDDIKIVGNIGYTRKGGC